MPRGGYPSDKQDQYMVRFPDGLRDQLKAEAERNKRSMNAEIIARLERSLGNEGTFRGMREELGASSPEVLEASQQEAAKILEALENLAALRGYRLKEKTEEDDLK